MSDALSRQPQMEQQEYWYRGTTRNWHGGAGARALTRTSLTTDPLVATLFAIEAARKGEAGVYFVPCSSVYNYVTSGNCFANIEREIALKLLPEKLFSCRFLPVAAACEILIEIGHEVPNVISTTARLQHYLSQLGSSDAGLSYLSEEELRQFDDRARLALGDT